MDHRPCTVFNYFSVHHGLYISFASFLAGTFNFINPAPQCKLLKLNEPRLNVFFACTARLCRHTNTDLQIQNSNHNLAYLLLTKIS